MNKKKKIIIVSLIIVAIIAVIAIVSYNNSMQEEYELNDMAKEIFLSGQIVNKIDDINSMTLDDVKKWLNNKNIYPDGGTERLDYYEFYTKAGEFIIVEKSTGDVSYSIHKDIREQRDYLANNDIVENTKNKKVDYNKDGVIDEKDKNKTMEELLENSDIGTDFNGNKHPI